MGYLDHITASEKGKTRSVSRNCSHLSIDNVLEKMGGFDWSDIS